MPHFNHNNRTYQNTNSLTPEAFKRLYGYENIQDMYFMEKYKKEVSTLNSLALAHNEATGDQKISIQMFYKIMKSKLNNMINNDIKALNELQTKKYTQSQYQVATIPQ